MKHTLPVWGIIVALCLANLPADAQILAASMNNEPYRTNSQGEQNRKGLKSALNDLEAKYKVSFVYRIDLVENKEVEFKDNFSSVEDALNYLLKDFDLQYKRMKKDFYVISYKDKKRIEKIKIQNFPQQGSSIYQTISSINLGNIEQKYAGNSRQAITVAGKVTDDKGEALPGVNVLLKGTTTGTTTDSDGNYTLTLPDGNAILVFSFIGYITEEVAINNRSTIDVSLVPDIQTLNEVVVTGYSSQSKKDITGSIATVDSKQLNQVPAPSLAQQLQGRVAGVTVGTDNSPGGETMVRIRGFGTINGNNPLYVVDGVPVYGGLAQINSNNIESMTVLKDASAAAIYGTRAANGVIIITTKKGKAGEPKIDFSARYGIQKAANKLDLLNTQELGQLLYHQAKNAYDRNPDPNKEPFVFNHGQYGSDPNAPNFIPDYIFPSKSFEGAPGTNPDDYDISDKDGDGFNLITKANKEGTDWYDEIFQPASLQEYNLGVSGGTENARYAFNAGYFGQNGIVKYTGFDRYSLRANSEFAVKKRIRVGENLEFSYSERNPISNNNEGSPISQAYRMQPIIPVYDIKGNFAGAKGNSLGNGQNPVAQLYRGKDNVTKNARVLGSGFIEADLLKGLTYKTLMGFDLQYYNISSFTVRNIEAAEVSSANSLGVQNNYNLLWNWVNTLTYENTFFDIHRMKLLLGTEATKNSYRGFSASRSNFFSDDPDYRYLNAGQAGISNSGEGYDWRLFSMFANLNYSLKEKYLLQATIRRDGSSRFGPNNRYGVFPSFSAGWRISAESFMSPLTFINDMKIRAGWGRSGNDRIGDYNGFNTYRTSITNSSYDINGSRNSVVPGFDTDAFGNPNTKWESTTTFNLGFDATLLENKLTVNFDWYNRLTSDMLYQKRLPLTQGVASIPFENVGEMRNKGIDLGLTYNGSAISNNFQYNVSANISGYQNEILHLSGNENEILYGYNLRGLTYTQSEKGRPISSFYGYQIEGIFQTEEDVNKHATFGSYNAVGKFKFRDVNGDGVINDKDRTYIGSPHPDFTYGLNIDLSYKNFDLTTFFQGVQGNQLINYVRRWIDFNTFQGNRSNRMLYDSWTPEHTNASLPILDVNDVTSLLPSTYFIENGSYFRMKNIQLGYTFPQKLLGRLGTEQVRIYVQATNLFTITKYSGLDPEVNLSNYGDGGDRQFGVDQGLYPTSRSYIVGLNIGF